MDEGSGEEVFNRLYINDEVVKIVDEVNSAADMWAMLEQFR